MGADDAVAACASARRGAAPATGLRRAALVDSVPRRHVRRVQLRSRASRPRKRDHQLRARVGVGGAGRVADVHATESSNPKEASHANSGTWTLSSGSGALGQLDVTWALRTERPDRKMSLEGLIADAQAWEQ